MRALTLCLLAMALCSACVAGTEPLESAPIEECLELGHSQGTWAQAQDRACSSDSDCVAARRTACCPCSNGGPHIAVHRDRIDDLERRLELECPPPSCGYVYGCADESVAARCILGVCRLCSEEPDPSDP